MTGPQITAIGPAPDAASSVSTYTLIRPDDQVALSLTVDGASVEGGEIVASASGAGSLSVWHSSQHVVESTAAFPERIFSAPTTLVFTLPAGTRIPLTVEGVLTALPALPIRPAQTVGVESVLPAPAAAAGAAELVAGTGSPSRADQRGATARIVADRERRAEAVLPAPTATSATVAGEVAATGSTGPTTALRFPSRLVLSPRGGAMRFAHASLPVEHGGRVELWHTRLARQRADGRLVEVDAALPVVDTIETGGVADSAIDNALDKNTRNALKTHARNATPPIADRLALSLLGAWLDVELDRPNLPVAWRHELRMGRDQYVRTVNAGTLYPLGHRAALTQVTRRGLPAQNGARAGLQTTQRITVLGRDRNYDDKGDAVERAWPWRRVRILTTSTPDGNLATFATSGSGANAKTAQWLTVPGPDGAAVPFEYRCEAIDRGGRTSSFHMPLVFVPDGFADLRKVETAFAAQPATARTVTLTGQTVSVAVPGIAADATDVVVHAVRLGTVTGQNPAATPAIRPLVEELVGRVPALDAFSPGSAAAVALRYAKPYLDHGFGGVANVGEAFLELIPKPALPRPVVDLTRSALTGGLAGLKYDLVGISRTMGPFGGTIADVAEGRFNPATVLAELTDSLRVLGVFRLRDLLGALPMSLDHAPNLTTTAVDGLVKSTLTWTTDLFTGVPAGKGLTPAVSVAPATGLLRRRRDPTTQHDLAATLTLRVDTTIDSATGASRTHTRCSLTNLELVLGLSGTELVVVPVESITFDSVDGKKPDFDVNLGHVEFLGVLRFIATLARLIPGDAFHDPPALDVRSDGITSSVALPVPAVAVGMFSLENIVLTSRLDVFFTAQSPTLEIGFARRESPFRLTVAALGGGGYVSVLLATDGLRVLEGSLEFGAAISVNLGVAKGSVSVMGGVAFLVAMIDGTTQATITAYLRVRGELRVLGLISIGVELLLAMSYQPGTGKIRGEAELAVRIKVLFFKKTVKVRFEKTFAGANADPTFAELMAHDSAPGDRAWDHYCLAFTEG